MIVKIEHVIGEFGDKSERHDLMAYVEVTVSLDGWLTTYGVMVGVPEYQHGTCKASAAGMRQFATAWWADSTDWELGGQAARDAVLHELQDKAMWLWTQVRGAVS